MANEWRNYPSVPILGDANFNFLGIVRSGTLMKVSPSEIQIECQHNLIEQLSRVK
jgi:hypothetical protein